MSRFGRAAKEKVWLNVYDLNPNNDALIWLGLGAFHSGIEIHGTEWTFGSGGGTGTGVFSHAPKGAPNAPLRTTILLGEAQVSSREVEGVIASLKPEWRGKDYHLIRKNCNHFAEELAIRLLGVRLPGWVNRLSGIGQALSCIIPEAVWTGGAPVNGGAGEGGGGDDDDEGGGGRSFQVFPGRGAPKPAASGVAPGGAAYTLGTAAGAGGSGGAAAGPGRPGTGAAPGAARGAAAAAAMRRLQQQAMQARGDGDDASLLPPGPTMARR